MTQITASPFCPDLTLIHDFYKYDMKTLQNLPMFVLKLMKVQVTGTVIIRTNVHISLLR